MADATVESAPAPATPAKKTKAAKASKTAKTAKPKTAPTHPKTSEMVNKAIGELKERGGSSLRAIKKYIATNYKVDSDRIAPFIKRYIIAAVEQGQLVRTKGKGAAGSFKLEGKTKPAAKPKKAPTKSKGVKEGRVTKKRAAPKKAAASPAKAKKAPAKTKKAAAASPAKKAKKPKSPTKAKKIAKPPTKKPKSPKPKKTTATKAKAAKKTAKK